MGTIETYSSTPQLEEIITEDGILCLILSSLTLKEAVAASVLSRRWIHLSAHLPKLILDAPNLLDDRVAGDLANKLLPYRKRSSIQLANRIQFIQFVNAVLQQQQGRAGLEEFRVHYFLHKAHSHLIDEWVRFAVTSKTKNLYIHLYQDYSNFEVELYDFPYQLLGLPFSLELLSLSSCLLKVPRGFHIPNHLVQLHLYDVPITEEDINNLLGSVRSTLNLLILWYCGPWVKLSIPHSLSQLQRLALEDCGQFTKVEINAPKLKRMRYRGVPVDFIFRQSSLEYAEIHFNKEGSAGTLDSYITELPRNLPHLQTLIFQISNVSQVSDLPKGSNAFIHLTRLDWIWNVGVKMSLLRLATILNATPLLEEFKLRLSKRTEEAPPQQLGKLRESLPNIPHSNLKTIEIHDFYCDKWQIEIALYLFNNAIKLESIKIEKGCEHFMENREVIMKILSQEAPANAKFVIL